MLRTGADLKRVSDVTSIGTRLPSDQSEVFIQQKGVKRLKLASDGELTLNDASGSIQASITDKGVSLSQLQLQGKTTDPLNPLPGTLIYDQQAEKIKVSRNNGTFETLGLATDNELEYVKQNHIGHETPIDLKYTIRFSIPPPFNISLRSLTFERSGINQSSDLYTYQYGYENVIVVFDPALTNDSDWDQKTDITDVDNNDTLIPWERNKLYRFVNGAGNPITSSFHLSPMFVTLNDFESYETSLLDISASGQVYFLITSLKDHFHFVTGDHQHVMVADEDSSIWTNSVKFRHQSDIANTLAYGRQIEYPQYNFTSEKDLNLSFFITKNTGPDGLEPRFDTQISISDHDIYNSPGGYRGRSDHYGPAKHQLDDPLKSSDGEDIFFLDYTNDTSNWKNFTDAPYVTRSVMDDIQEQYTHNRIAFLKASHLNAQGNLNVVDIQLPGISVSPSTLDAFAETLLLSVNNQLSGSVLDLALSINPAGLTVMTLDVDIFTEFFELDLNPYADGSSLGPILGFTSPDPLTIDVSVDEGVVVDDILRRYIFISSSVGTWVRQISFLPVHTFNLASYNTYLTIEYKSSTQQARVGIQNVLCGNEGPLDRLLIDGYETLLDLYMDIDESGLRSELSVEQKTRLFMNEDRYTYGHAHAWIAPLKALGVAVQKTGIKYTPYFSLSAYTSNESNLTIRDDRFASMFTITDLTQKTKLHLPDSQRELYSPDTVVLDLSTLKGYVALPILTEGEKLRLKSSTGGLLGFFDGKLQYTTLNGEWKEIAIV